jgi:DNA-binding response OmpR family regulator
MAAFSVGGTNARFWSVTDRDREAARWRGLFKSAGAPESGRLESVDSLRRIAGAKREGLALIDAALLKGRAGDIVLSFRKRCPGVQLIVVCDERALEGPDLADALAAGALDYLRSARADDALVDKLRLHLRRLYPRSLASEAGRLKDLRIDWRSRTVEVRQGGAWREIAALTPKEFDLLKALFERRGARIRRTELLECVWRGRSGSINPESLDKAVGSLRKKLGPAGKRIRTVRGFGYSFD